ncbi:neutral protease 2-like protein [Zopfia rhizophila CBS 207.26]|uniref:Neutral protease 2 n=1 Tax=Zopfia rhizophila CBS 207.26 TaxID=1314779 RepID=A0A6A6EPA7_9PEZI|nr:neutral protease 2-like protein [Zopfia rhizophila CBS 207.26]
MKFLSIAALATLASAVSVDLTKRETPLDVKLEMVGNTAVKASIKNTGTTDLKVFKTGTFLDDSAVEKVEVFRGDSQVAFDGIRLQVTTMGLGEEAFQVIPAGETVEATFDIAEAHDLSNGGAVDIVSAGAVSFAEADSTEIAGIVPFSSNRISAEVNGAEAAKVRRAFPEKRTVVQSDCTGTRRTATLSALSNCRSLASAAASAANSNTAKMVEYFKSSSSSTRSTVAAVFNRIVSECGSSTSGVSRQYCSDVLGACSSGVLAYTQPSSSLMVSCPLYFSALPALTSSCHAQDQATTTLHETTHLTQIKGTSDYGAYGYNAVRGLTAAQNLNHADTYSLFANGKFEIRPSGLACICK